MTEIKTSSLLIQQFRAKVPVAANGEATYMSMSFNAPMNTIVSGAIERFVSISLSEVNSKETFEREGELCRSAIASHLNTDPSNIVFTRDTTEGANIFQNSIEWSKGDNVVVLDTEHPSFGYGWMSLQRDGLDVRLVPVSLDHNAVVNGDFLGKYVDDKTRAIALSSVTYHSGLRNDIKHICSKFRPKGIHVLVDVTQEVGLAKIDIQDLGVSALVFSTHKGLSIPTGLGILYIDPLALRDLKPIPPMLSGTAVVGLNTKSIITPDFEVHPTAKRYEHSNKGLLQIFALKAFLEFIDEVKIDSVEHYLRSLSRLMRTGLKNIGVEVLGSEDESQRSPHCNVVPIFNPEWQRFLVKENVIVQQYRGGIRISLGLYNNEDDVQRLLSVFKKGLDQSMPFN